MDHARDPLSEVEDRLGRQLPKEFRTFYAKHGAGPIVESEDVYAEISSAEDMIAINELPEIRDAFPELLLFGGDGSREHFALDYRSDPPRVVMLDLSSAEEDAVVEQAANFDVFVRDLPSRGLRFGD